MKIKGKAPPRPQTAQFAPQGVMSPSGESAMAKPVSPGGGGFLIDHNAFTDATPPSSRGMRKTAGYPNFAKNP